MRITKVAAAFAAATLVGVGVIGSGSAASASDGQQFVVNGDFLTPTVNGLLATPNTTTDFTLAVPGLFGEWANRDLGSMYDAGRYVIASNPASLHEFWAEFPDGDPSIVNGHTEGSHTVWAQQVALGEQCTTGSRHLPVQHGRHEHPPSGRRPGGGGREPVGAGQRRRGRRGRPDRPRRRPQGHVRGRAYQPVVRIEIRNNATAYSGNDFAIDDISLTQVGACEPPCVPVTTAHWYVYNGPYPNDGTVPPLSDPSWHATAGNPQSANHALAVRGTDRPEVLALRAHAPRDALASDGDQQHRNGGAECVREREQDGVEADLVLRRERGDRREHGSGARHEDETEADAEQEPAAEVAAAPPRHERERTLQHVPDLRNEQSRREHEQHRDREVAKEVLRQPERREQRRRREREQREARDEAGDDRERATAAPGRAAGEHDRQHRQDARRHCGDHTGEEADAEQHDHRSKSTAGS